MIALRRGLVVVGVVLALWWGLSEANMWTDYVLPPPGRVWRTAVTMVTTGELVGHVLVSLGRVLVGFGAAFLVAFALGLLGSAFPRPIAYVTPALSFLRNVPPLSLIPLLILWFGIGETAKILVIALTAFFPMYMSTVKGLRACNPHLLDVGVVRGLSPTRSLVLIRLPHAVPDVLVGMRISLGFAWRALVGAEMIAAASGLGYLVLDAQVMSRSDKVIVGILAIGLAGMTADRVFAQVTRRTRRWGIDDSWS